MSTSSPSRTLPFFVVACSLSWAGILPTLLVRHGVLAGPAERFMALVPLAVLSPTLAAALVSRFERGGAGALAVFRPLRDFRVRPVWYLVALGICGVSFLAGMVVYRLAGGVGSPQWVYPPDNGERVAALFFLPLFEEIGWRGFALPRLQRNYRRLSASLLLGVGWALWHIPMFLFAGLEPGLTMAVALLFFLPGSVIFSWVFNRTGGSLPLAIVTHFGAHLNNSHRPLPAVTAPLYIHAAALAVLAVVLLVADRRAWLEPKLSRC